ncbi:SDR family NAD(P)-dependent oxidoreductase [Frigidibacter mobilis]|uniref:Short chain dehydrogenase/reductase family oxidoreductase n=1 Tax=Frigidibacter mobilis TaxID=1335048 RepID=A0A159Z5Z0_9RHOB|nr:SDR family NAD(P)-dependent oxidoreductase [Frigidibacter mobilis]AMY70717.1 short chain dehydrogenase/reductase family oxidoreductase [Frigidibacter mobilis]
MTILITGANRGIGRALLDGYRGTGADAIGTARGALPEGAGWQALDVTDPASARALAARLAGQPITTLICNAGVYADKGQRLEDGYPAEIWAESFAVNVTGVFLTVQALLPNLRAAAAAKGLARIAIISSQMASHTRAPGGSYAYRASKAAALNLGRNLATDLRAEGIAVGIYHPGWVQTEMGGSGAEIAPDVAAAGLRTRFAALDMATTGCFETWDGTPHAY